MLESVLWWRIRNNQTDCFLMRHICLLVLEKKYKHVFPIRQIPLWINLFIRLDYLLVVRKVKTCVHMPLPKCMLFPKTYLYIRHKTDSNFQAVLFKIKCLSFKAWHWSWTKGTHRRGQPTATIDINWSNPWSDLEAQKGHQGQPSRYPETPHCCLVVGQFWQPS